MTDQAVPASTGQKAFSSHGQYTENKMMPRPQSGYLTYSVGPPARLTFMTDEGEIVFDGSIREFHSPALADYNATLEIWQGGVRHRVCLIPGGVWVANMLAEFTTDPTARNWLDLLAPQVGPKPPGVVIHTPMSKGKRVALNWAIGLVVAFVIIVAVVIFTAIGAG